jgi:ABC-type lipoprotein release transport system permease subunit
VRGLPLEYAVRNLGRRPLRTALTGTASLLVGALLVATAAFVRGLHQSLLNAAQDDVAILLSSVAERDVVRSTVPASVPEIVAAAVPGLAGVSPEIHFGTNLRLGGAREGQAAAAGDHEPTYQAFVRGVTPQAFRVHDAVTLLAGRLPGPGEVLVGSLVAARLGVPPSALEPGSQLRFEGGTFTVAGRFAAPGTTTAAEIWASLHELRGLTKRDDSSAVFVRVAHPDAFADLELWSRRRLDLELVSIPSRVYYREAAEYLAPIATLSWALALMIAAAALFGGANTLNAAVVDRTRELATLRALGYSSGALVRSLLAESLVLAAAGGLLGLWLGRLLLEGAAFRIAMSAFALEVDAPCILAGLLGVLWLGALGVLPAALRVTRLPVAAALKEA